MNNPLDLVQAMAMETAEEFRKEKNDGQPVEIPDFGPGDQVEVDVLVVEGDKERIQTFKGVVLYRRGSGMGETFCVRKLSDGIGVERIFPVRSPFVQAIRVTRKGKVRRARLYYLRNLTEKQIRAKTAKSR